MLTNKSQQSKFVRKFQKLFCLMSWINRIIIPGFADANQFNPVCYRTHHSGGGDGGGGDGGDGDDGGSDGGTDDDNNNDEDENRAEEAINEQPLHSSYTLPEELLRILPSCFSPGIDGLGSRNLQQRQAASLFRKPWTLPDETIQKLVRHSKPQFFEFVRSCIGAGAWSKLNLFAQCLLFLLKVCHQLPFNFLAVLFGLQSKDTAIEVFTRILIHQYKTN